MFLWIDFEVAVGPKLDNSYHLNYESIRVQTQTLPFGTELKFAITTAQIRRAVIQFTFTGVSFSLVKQLVCFVGWLPENNQLVNVASLTIKVGLMFSMRNTIDSTISLEYLTATFQLYQNIPDSMDEASG